jgi:hypothetical protein
MTSSTRQRVLRVGLRGAAIALIVGALIPGPRVPISQQWPLFSELREVAAIIFGLIGVWMALLHPKAFEQVLKFGRRADPRFARLLRPFWYAAAIVACVVTYGLVRAWMGAFLDVLWPYHSWFRAASLALLSGLVLLQLWALLLAVSPVDELRDELYDAAEAREQVDQLRRLRRQG